jgi:hypothetical protein
MAGGCGSGDNGKGTASANQERVDYVNGELLATIDDGSDHRIEFYDFGYGIRGCRESSLQDTASWLAGLPIEGKSLTEIYQLVRPQAVVPQAIRDADARARIDLARIAAADPAVPITQIVSPPANVSPPVDLGLAKTGQTAPLGAAENVSQVGSAAIVCGPDVNGDNWAAQWFKTLYYNNNGTFKCTNGFTQTPLFGTNYAWQQITAHAGQNYMYHQFEGDGVNYGTSIGKWIHGSTVQTMWNTIVEARHVSSWWMSGGSTSYIYDLSGSSPCNHMGYALVDCSSFG